MSDVVQQLVLGANVGGHIAGPVYSAAEVLVGRAYGSAHTYMERVEGRKVARARLLNISVPEWRKELEGLETQRASITEKVEALHSELKTIADNTDLSRYKRTGEPDRVSAYANFLSPGINAYRAAVAAGKPVDNIPEEVKLAARLADLKRAARNAMGKKGQGQVPQEIKAEMDGLHKRLEVMSAGVDLTHYMRPVVHDPVEALLESVATGIGAYRKSTEQLKSSAFPAAVVKGVEFIDLRRKVDGVARTIEKTQQHIASAAEDHIDLISFGEPLFDAEVAFGLSCRLLPVVSIDLPSYAIQAIAAMGIGSNDNNLQAMQDSRAERHERIRTAANKSLSLIVLAEDTLPDVTTHVKGRLAAHGYEDAVAAVVSALEKRNVPRTALKARGAEIWEATKSEKSIRKGQEDVQKQDPSHMYG